MTEQVPNHTAVTQEKRLGSDRRTRKHDELFKHAVTVGYFVDMRKSDRRQSTLDVNLDV